MHTIMIIDDDINVVKMISSIINKNNLGKVVSELYDGKHAVDEIKFYNPDILLIDYLMPSLDGIEIINKIRRNGFVGKIIMISQVEEQSMISKAYNSGVLFFISKPINSIEIVNILKNVSQNIELEHSLHMIKSALSNVSTEGINVVNIDSKIEDILTDLGIIGDSGAQDLIKIINRIYKLKRKNSNVSYKLSDIYEEEANDYKNIKSLKQRVRRTIQKSLNNIAEMGLGDFYNPKFIEYSSLLFDLKQVKQEMKHIEDPTQVRGRINIKKFIEGIITKI